MKKWITMSMAAAGVLLAGTIASAQAGQGAACPEEHRGADAGAGGSATIGTDRANDTGTGRDSVAAAQKATAGQYGPSGSRRQTRISPLNRSSQARWGDQSLTAGTAFIVMTPPRRHSANSI